MMHHAIIFALSQISPGGLPQPKADASSIQTGLSIVYGVVGALALLMITISGLRYVASAGDPQKTAQAKNGIVYAIVGLAIAIGAQAITAFIVGKT